MFRHEITYNNFNGQPVTKAFYFNITKAELALAELESDGTWSQSIEKIAQSSKGSEVIPEFKKIIKWTYGEKSADGESFDKSDEAWARFVNSEPWSQLVWDLLTKDNFAATFINSVLPPDLSAAAREAAARNGFRPGASTDRPVPPAAREVQQAQVVSSPGVPQQSYNQQPNYGSAGAQQGGIEQVQQPAQPVYVPAPQQAQPQQAAPLYDVNTAQAPQPLTPEQAQQYQTRHDAIQAEQGIQHESTPRTDIQQ